MSKKISFFAVLFYSTLLAAPQHSATLSGDVSLSQIPQLLEVNASDRSIIEWNSFSIGADEMVRFIQPSEAAVVLNRVVGQDLSEIFGTLQANGIIYLINPRGILIGENGLIDTASFLASTLDLSNEAFLQGQELLFEGSSDASLIQLGTIQARQGDIALIAHQINNTGLLEAPLGSVSLAAGHEILLKPQNYPLLNIRPDLRALGIENQGVIKALNAYLQSDSLSTFALEQKGDIVLLEQEGKILLFSEGGSVYIDTDAHLIAPAGDISLTLASQEESKPIYLLGTLDVSAEQGGSIKIQAPKLLNAGILNADGTKAAGEIALSIQESLIETSAAKTSANGGKQAGSITYDSFNIFSSGSLHAQGKTGGTLNFFGHQISLAAANLSTKGSVSIGSKEQMPQKIFIHPSTQIDAPQIQIEPVDGIFPQIPLIDPNAGSGTGFGTYVAVLSKGNIVVAKPNDNFAATAAGAVYLYNGSTGALISMVTGSSASDQIGYSGITTLIGNDNYVVASPLWSNGGVSDVGAATWGNGTTGITGVISISNSLVGTGTNNNVGGRILALTNGNYVVLSRYWDLVPGVTTNVGAVTWGNGSTGITGTVSISNSLIGSRSDDELSSGGVTALSNGNYVVSSPNWSNGVVTTVGAATWGNGTTGITGTVSVSNSLIGSTAADHVSSSGIVALSNGNYVVASSDWDNGGIADVGAATWGNGTTGITGTVSISNSLIGSTSSDRVSHGGVTALSNGNYVVRSPNWDNGGVVNAGAATWGNGSTGITGTVSISNSLIGSSALDQVGTSIIALPNGNYIARSPNWDNGGVVNAGAATWGNGSTGITGTVSISNSLIGSTENDGVGIAGIIALTNSNYVVLSPNWDNGGIADVGAATWGNGSTGLTGTVSVSNSLVGSIENDQVGVFGSIALTNGNYVVASPFWNNGDVSSAGAATWCNGSTGFVGTVSISNSLVGSTENDLVTYFGGSSGITALANGDYVVASASWDWVDEGLTDSGAATWGSGTEGIAGVITIANSVLGTVSSSDLQPVLDNPAFPVSFVSSFPGGDGAVIIGGVPMSSSPNTNVVGASQARIDYARSINEPFQIWRERLFGPYLSEDRWPPMLTPKGLRFIRPSLVRTDKEMN